MTTIDNITDEQIRTLQHEAEEHGDANMAECCKFALASVSEPVRYVCRIECVKAINAVEGMAES